MPSKKDSTMMSFPGTLLTKELTKLAKAGSGTAGQTSAAPCCP